MCKLIKYKRSFLATSIKDFKNSIVEDLSSISFIADASLHSSYFGLLMTFPNNKSHLAIFKKSNRSELLKFLEAYFDIYKGYLSYSDDIDLEIAKEQLDSIFSSIYALIEDDFELSSSDLQNLKKLKYMPVKSMFSF